MSSTTNIAVNSRSLNGIVTISDGAGTTIENGNIETGNINSANLTTSNINTSLLTCTGKFDCNLNGPYTIPTSISSLTGLLISYGNTTNSGATDFTNYQSTYTSTQGGFRFWNKSNTQTLTNMAIIDNTQTYFKSQLVGCLAESPVNPTSVANKTYIDTNFVDRTNNLTQSISGQKTFSNNLTCSAQYICNNIQGLTTTSACYLWNNLIASGTISIGTSASSCSMESSAIFNNGAVFNSVIPTTSLIASSNNELVNFQCLNSQGFLTTASILNSNNSWSGTNTFSNFSTFNNVVEIVSALNITGVVTLKQASISINSSTANHNVSLFNSVVTGTIGFFDNLTSSICNMFHTGSTSTLNLNAKVKFRQLKLYNQVKVTTGGTLSFPLEETILINSGANVTINLPAITANAVGLTFTFIKNNSFRVHTFTANGTDTIIKNGYVTGSTSVNLFDDGITSLQLVIVEIVPSSGLYNWVQISGLPAKMTSPVGSILTMSVLAVPAGYFACAGQTTLTSAYPDLFAVIGYTYGGSGANFMLPNFNNGSFLRGFGGNSLAIGTQQGENIKTHSHDIKFGYNQTFQGTGGSYNAYTSTAPSYNNPGGKTGDLGTGRVTTTSELSTAGSPDETRPINYAVYYCIKY